MRWFCIRKATIDPELRETFERYGKGSMQVILSTTNYFRHKGNSTMVESVLDSLLPWLTEQDDRAERKETWSITMEVAITILVAAELALSIIMFRLSVFPVAR
jgi:hypothetical protein